MVCIRQQYILLKRTKQCFWPLLLFLAGTLAHDTFSLCRGLVAFGAAVISCDAGMTNALSLNWQLYGFLLLMFVTYEYFTQARTADAEETLRCTGYSRLAQELAQFAVLMAWLFLYFILHYLKAVIIACIIKPVDMPLLILMLKAFLLYVGALFFMAVLLGYILSYIPRRPVAYVALVLLAFYMVQRSHPGHYVSGFFGRLTQIFGLFARYGSGDAFGVPVEAHFFWGQLFNVAALLFISAFLWFFRYRKKWTAALLPICLIVCACSVHFFSIKTSGCYYGYADDAFINNDEERLWEDAYEEDCKPDFYVLSYDVKLKVDTQLQADVTVSLSDSGLSKYAFTLFSGYALTAVTDTAGNALEYETERNVIRVFNPGGSLSGIRFCYRGAGTNNAYAGRQGIYLQGNFPYYPMAGEHNYDPTGLCDLMLQESDFSVTVDYDKMVYSNLQRTGDNTFAGKSNNMTLAAGFWEEKEYEGVTYLYAKYCNPADAERNAFLKTGFDEYLDMEIADAAIPYTLKGKKIIISPTPGLAGRYMFGSDAVVLYSPTFDLDTYYVNYVKTGHWYCHENEMTEQEILDIINEEE